MEFYAFVAFIVIVILLIKSRKEIKELRNQINFLDGKIRDLYDKAYYNYEQIKELKNDNVTNGRNDVQTAANDSENISDTVQKSAQNTVNNVPPQLVKNPIRPQPVQEKPFNPYGKLENIPTIFKDNVSENIPVMNMNTSLVGSSRKKDFAAAESNSPVQQNTDIPHLKKSTNPPQFKSFENWLGTRLFNVAASLMIFIGLVLFCTLGYEYITNTMKMAAMFVVSGSFIALGAFFTRQNKSVFSLGLTGCGFGSFFISILLSHVYFQVLIDAAAFGLLLVWAIFALYMSKKLDSVMLSVTAHMGTAVSICFAFSLGFSAHRIILPVAYQMAAIAVIIIGNIFCCKKTYRFGLFMSEILLIYTSIVMCAKFGNSAVMLIMVSPVFTAVIFAVQFIAISFVSYLISVSTAALETENPKLKNLSDIIFFTHIANKILWTTGVITSVGVITYFILNNIFNIDSLVYPTLAVCAAAVGHLLVTLFMSEKLNFNEKLSKISIWINSIVVMLSLFTQSTVRETLHGIPFVFVYIGFVMLIIRYTKNKKLNHLAAFLIGCEMIYMTIYGYFAAANVVVSIAYMIVVGAEILLHWFMQSGESRQRRFTFFKIAEYLWISASIIPINVSEFSDISFPLILSEFAFMNIIAYILKYGRDNEPELQLTVKIESLATIYIGIAALMFNGVGSIGDILAIKIVFIILLAFLTSLYIKDFVKSESTALQVLSAATVSGFITAFFIGFADSLRIADIYTNVLQCKPLFLITAIAIIIIYRYNRNHELQIFVWSALGIDAFLMLFFGYNELVLEFEDSVSFQIISIAICIIHSVIDGLLLYYTWKLQNKKQKKDSLTFIKTIEYFWINLSVYKICTQIPGGILPNEFRFAVLVLINVILYILEYNKSSRILDRIVKINSSIILYISIILMAEEIHLSQRYVAVNYTVRIGLILLAVGLYYLIAREIIKSKSVFVQVYVGLTATCIVNAACRGLSNIFEIAYIFSIVTMITALVCITVGFAAKTKGLRVYGLIVVMLCVIKLVTFDIGTTNADSMSRVVAFIVGGIVCFIISGIYNKVESKFINEENKQK